MNGVSPLDLGRKTLNAFQFDDQHILDENIGEVFADRAAFAGDRK